ncbi:flagellar protein FlaG [Sulfurirhabdus autotrophica]|uniref:Flagellar protein FlaG n=1 Tax=Sulfurirhabdus autotrophica TaxID=1706046 RepID=A0A4R3YDH7_9PROT|nr:flagellar protein FlaG [Sulfurirhabdus autotrophica]TCV90167.1 flagellar protein FlaG [Sulfurirhabdus autotrophica]
MIIQNTNLNQPAQSVRPFNDSLPNIVSDVGSTPGVAQISTNQTSSLQQPSPEQLKNAVDVINLVMKHSNNNLQFSVDTDTNRTVVKMVDTETGELIRQFPSEETLAISREIDRFQQGLLLKQKA